MTTALAENPAVLDPFTALSRAHRDALAAAAFFRHHRKVGGAWQMGEKRFAVATVNAVIKAGLLRMTANGLVVTQAGELALEKIRRTA